MKSNKLDLCKLSLNLQNTSVCMYVNRSLGSQSDLLIVLKHTLFDEFVPILIILWEADDFSPHCYDV